MSAWGIGGGLERGLPKVSEEVEEDIEEEVEEDIEEVEGGVGDGASGAEGLTAPTMVVGGLYPTTTTTTTIGAVATQGTGTTSLAG